MGVDGQEPRLQRSGFVPDNCLFTFFLENQDMHAAGIEPATPALCHAFATLRGAGAGYARTETRDSGSELLPAQRGSWISGIY